MMSISVHNDLISTHCIDKAVVVTQTRASDAACPTQAIGRREDGIVDYPGFN